MPWKLIIGVLIGVVLLTFIGLNWQNTTAISFGFVELEEIPAVIAILAAFIAGMVISIPFAVATARRQANKAKTRQERVQQKAEKQASKPASGHGGLFAGRSGDASSSKDDRGSSKKAERAPKMKQDDSHTNTQAQSGRNT